MTVEQRSLLHLMREALNPHGIHAMYRKGQFLLQFVDERAGLISWAVTSEIKALKLGYDMRDNRRAYVAAKLRHDEWPVTAFFQHNIPHIQPGIS